MEPSSYADIVRRLRDLGPFPDDTSARAALSASLLALGAVLSKVEQAALASALPAELAQVLRASPPWVGTSRPDFFRTAATYHRAPTPLAVEHTAVVCRAISEVLTPTARKRLARAVPALARLLAPTTEGAPGHAEAPRAEDPHGETKRSPSCGLAQERESRTLSYVHRRPVRPSSGRE